MCTLYTYILYIFHHLLPIKTLAVLDSPCNDVAIKQMIAILLQAVLGILGKTGYKEHARKKRHLLLLLQCSYEKNEILFGHLSRSTIEIVLLLVGLVGPEEKITPNICTDFKIHLFHAVCFLWMF